MVFFGRWWIQGFRPWEDALQYGWPSESLIVEQLSQFKLPLWDPYSYGGDSWLGKPIYGIFYPGQIWMIVTAWIVGNPVGPTPYGVWIAAHHVVAGIGMWILMRHLKMDSFSRFFAAMAYALAMSTVLRFRHTCYLIPIVWMPVIAWLALRYVEKPTWRRVAVLGVAMGGVFLGTTPQYIFFVGMLVIILVLCSIAQAHGRRWLLITRLATAFLIALGILSTGLLSNVEYAIYSGRIASPMTLVDSQASPWWVMARAFFPFLTGYVYPRGGIVWGSEEEFGALNFYEEAIYPGLVIWLGFFLFVASRGWTDRRSWLWIGVLIAGICWSVGEFNVVRVAVRWMLYPIATARVPLRGWCLAELALVVLAIWGFHRYGSMGRPRKWAESALGMLVACFIASLAIAVWRYHEIPPTATAWPPMKLSQSEYELKALMVLALVLTGQGLILTVLSCLLLRFESLWNKNDPAASPARYILAGCLAMELFVLGVPCTQSFEDTSVSYRLPAGVNQVAEMMRPDHQRFWAGDLVAVSFRSAWWKIPSLQGYSTMRIPSTGDDFLIDRTGSGRFVGRRLDLYGVAAAIVSITPTSTGKASVRVAFRPTAYPKAWYCPDAEFGPSQNMLGRLDSPEVNLRQTVLLDAVDESTARAVWTKASRQAEGFVVVKRYDESEVILQAVCTAPGWVVINDHFAPGWNCEVDGIPSKIFKADCIFRAVPISGGTHTIRYWYWPQTLTIGLVAGAFTLVGAIVLILGKFGDEILSRPG